MSDVIVSHRSVVKESAAGIAKDAADIRDQVDLLAKANQELRELINQMRETEAVARETLLTQIGRESRAIQGAAPAMPCISEKRRPMTIARAYLGGIGRNPDL